MRPAPPLLAVLALWAVLGIAPALELVPIAWWWGGAALVAVLLLVDLLRLRAWPTPQVRRVLPEALPSALELACEAVSLVAALWMPASLTIACTARLPAVLMVTPLPTVAVTALSLSVHATAAPSLNGRLPANDEPPFESVLVLPAIVADMSPALSPCTALDSSAELVPVLADVLFFVVSLSAATVILPLLPEPLVKVGLLSSAVFALTVCRLIAPARPTEPVLLLAIALAVVLKLLLLCAPMSSEPADTVPLMLLSASTAACDQATVVAAKLPEPSATVLAATLKVLSVLDCTLSWPPLITLAPLAMLVDALLKTAPYMPVIITGSDPSAPVEVASVVAVVCVDDCSNTLPLAWMAPPIATLAVENERT